MGDDQIDNLETAKLRAEVKKLSKTLANIIAEHNNLIAKASLEQKTRHDAKKIKKLKNIIGNY